MNLLLDTSVAIWLLTDSPRLGTRSRQLIDAGQCYVSAVSVAEMTIKSMIGKLDIPDDLIDQLRDAGVVELPVTAAHAAAIGRFPQIARHDPFDRLLVAQAFCDRLDLLTADRVLLGLEQPWIVDATA